MVVGGGLDKVCVFHNEKMHVYLICMSGIGGHTVRPLGLKFGTETPTHPQIAQPNI